MTQHYTSDRPAGLGISLLSEKSLSLSGIQTIQTRLLCWQWAASRSHLVCLLLKGLSHILLSGMFISTLGMLFAPPLFRQNILSKGLS